MILEKECEASVESEITRRRILPLINDTEKSEENKLSYITVQSGQIS